jgi:TRAP-type C4-dicarboxylate transport system permease small subunit
MVGLFLFILLDILSRIFVFPLAGTAEITELLLGACALLALGYTQQAGMHVRVMVIISRLRPKYQAIIETWVDVIWWHCLASSRGKSPNGVCALAIETWTYGTIELPQWIGSLAALGCASLALAVLMGCCPACSLVCEQKQSEV